MKRSFLVLFLLLVPAFSRAQVPGLTTPNVSPAASVSQTIGLTEMTVSYHRPATNSRKVWGGLVPYDQVWRAGANQNTTVSFSTPVTVNGTKLKSLGTVGLVKRDIPLDAKKLRDGSAFRTTKTAPVTN